jgi:hypothetical protein
VSCSSRSLCVAVDFSGNVLTSTKPTGGVRVWRRTTVHRGVYLYGVSCPSNRLCVAVDGWGNAITSTDPTGGKRAWKLALIQTGAADGADTWALAGVSCPSPRFCAAVGWESVPSVGTVGDVFTATHLTGGVRKWSFNQPDSWPNSQNGLSVVACSSTTLCVAVDGAGAIFTSINPASVRPAWQMEEVDIRNSIDGLSCPSRSFCVAVDSAGNVLTSTNPASGAS